MIKGIIKKGEYFDSVTLMIVAKEINKLNGVIDSSIVMGTNENKAILKMANLFIEEFQEADDTDLLVSLNIENEAGFETVISKIEEQLKSIRNKTDNNEDFSPKSFEGALKSLPDANLSLISVAGKYAAKEAHKALDKGLHVMMFSDNVSIEEELQLKKKAVSKGLLMMGPDCGTAIINGIPLAFANVVNRGNIGIVAASGTGLQEVSTIISNLGAGISQAIGTGGRDVKKEIGGIMFIEAMKALDKDPETEIITLISKPPHNEVIAKIADTIKLISKPVVAILIGGDSKILEDAGAIAASNLEEAAVISASLAKKEDYKKAQENLTNRLSTFSALAENEAKGKKGKYLRGLFSGGTLCDESQLLLRDTIGISYSNTPLDESFKLKSIWKSEQNTIIDMGDDDFTAGRPHPMIDFSLRNKRIVEEAKDPETAVILLDVVIGYGSNLAPEKELEPAIQEAKKTSPNVSVVCSITGTDKDPQNRQKIKTVLENAGAIVMETNVEATLLTIEILKLLNN